jgi:hypothetical protein
VLVTPVLQVVLLVTLVVLDILEHQQLVVWVAA